MGAVERHPEDILEPTPEQLIEVHVSPRPQAREYALVLHALGIPHHLLDNHGQTHILVPAQQAEEARAQLQQYAAEGALRAGKPLPADKRAGIVAAGLWTLTLVLIHYLTIYGPGGAQSRAAISSASLVREGDWWRTITALTLHADHLHLLSNLVFGGLLIGLLAAEAGLGTAILLTLLGGALGNGANAFIAAEGHSSLGASTAVFASLGVLVGARFRQDRSGPARARAWVPLVAGLALLGWLGGPSERMGVNGVIRTDVPAHALGLAFGLLLGALILTPSQMHRHERTRLACAGALILSAWAVALW